MGCPKKMVFGPCGGVRPDGRCEMADHPCSFLGLPEPPAWPGPEASAQAATAPLEVALEVPMVLTDLSCPPADAAALTATARILAPGCDAVLVGDHQDRPDFPPSMLARMLAGVGVRPWVTLACRDRNRVVLEAELQGLRHEGAAGAVLCVTGDGRAYDVAPEVTQVFDLDGTRLAALATSLGLAAAVAESPTAAPTGLRPARLVAKERAGAAVAVLNHVRTPAGVAAFVAAARSTGLRIPVVASVSVYTDERSAAVLTALPGLEIDPTTVAAVVGSADPVEAGIRAAVREATALLAIPGVVGINLSGMASAQGVAFAAGVQAEIGQRIRTEQRRAA